MRLTESYFVANIMDIISEDLRPTRLFDFKSIQPMCAVLGENIGTIKHTLRSVIDEEYGASAETIQHKLHTHIQRSNTEIADVKVT